MKVLLRINNNGIGSFNLKTAFIQAIYIELPEFNKDIEEMIIEFGWGNKYYGNLLIENYHNIQSIIVKRNSLQNLKSLTICNCEKLKTIDIENGAFKQVTSVIIESSGVKFCNMYIFLIYSYLKQEIMHSKN